MFNQDNDCVMCFFLFERGRENKEERERSRNIILLLESTQIFRASLNRNVYY